MTAKAALSLDNELSNKMIDFVCCFIRTKMHAPPASHLFHRRIVYKRGAAFMNRKRSRNIELHARRFIENTQIALRGILSLSLSLSFFISNSLEYVFWGIYGRASFKFQRERTVLRLRLFLFLLIRTDNSTDNIKRQGDRRCGMNANLAIDHRRTDLIASYHTSSSYLTDNRANKTGILARKYFPVL